MTNATAGHVVDVDTYSEVVTVVATDVDVVTIEVVVDATSDMTEVVTGAVVVVVDSSVVRGVSLIRGIEVVGTGTSFGQNCELKPHLWRGSPTYSKCIPSATATFPPQAKPHLQKMRTT